MGLAVNETKLASELIDRLKALLVEWSPTLPGLIVDALERLLVGKRLHAVVKYKGVEVDISVTLETPSAVQIKGTV